MRISDWSSDVCSSDLLARWLHPLRQDIHEVGGTFYDYQQDRPGGIRCHSVRGGAGSCNRWRLVGPQALSRLQPWRLQHQQLLGRWQQLWRFFIVINIFQLQLVLFIEFERRRGFGRAVRGIDPFVTSPVRENECRYV